MEIIKGISKQIYTFIISPKSLDIRIYIENLFKLPRRPYFLVLNVKHIPQKIQNKIWNEIYLFDILYVPQIIQKQITNDKSGYQIRKDCYEIGNQLREILEYLPIEVERKKYTLKGTEITYQVVDLSLHFSITYAFHVYKDTDKKQTMEKIKILTQ